MTATNSRKARPDTGKAGASAATSRRRPAATGEPTTRGPQTRPDGPATRGSTPVRVRRREAARRIRTIADRSESLDVRAGLRRLAALVGRGSRNVQGVSFVETAIGECLDEAAAVAPRERWLICEAATWALAWLARTRRAGGSAGGLLERLVQAARSARASFEARDTTPVVFVLAVARLFCDIEACRCLEGDASAAVEEEIGRLVSTTGAVALAGSPAVLERVVRWTTAREIGDVTGSPAWNAATEDRWQAAAAAALRLLGGHGRVLVGAGRMPSVFSAPLLAALAAAPAKAVRKTAAAVEEGLRPDAAGSRRPADGRRKRLMPRDLHDAAAAVAVVRSGWDRDALRVMLEYRDAVPRLEIAAGDRLLFDGPWQWRVTVGGRPLEAEGPWILSCWESDRKATFFEITAPLPGGMRIDRQIVVVPGDRIVLLADAVTGGRGAEPLRYESVVPLAPTLEAERAEETRDVVGYDTAMRFTALPLALPEWTASGGGELVVDPGHGLVLRQQPAGPALHAPIWFDFDPARIGEPLTWRQLTVADTRRNLQPHEAAGYRVQVGPEQWLLYRSLDAPRNRSVLGCNLSCEFLIGRIGRRGMVTRTMEIQ